jgi:hypothetical protein
MLKTTQPRTLDLFVQTFDGSTVDLSQFAIENDTLRIPTGKPWYRHYTTLIWSAALTVAAAGIYILVHFSLTVRLE